MSEHAADLLSIRARLSFPGFRLDVNQELELKGVTGLFGPSGSGKSTLLRIIAGLEKQAVGQVRFAGHTWQDSATGSFVRPHQRPVGFVFQYARLFAHLDVAGNLRYALDRRHPQGEALDHDEVVAALNIAALLGRRVDALSGGERQRVAIARTLLSRPRLLLLDEPLAALDVGHKREILPYLDKLHERFSIPAVYVSHAVDEMARLADTVLVMDDGRISAMGSAQVILSRDGLKLPTIPFEAVTVLEVRIVEHLPGLQLTRVMYAHQQLTVPTIAQLQPGDTLRLSIRAADVVLATAEPHHLSVRNVLRGTIADISARGDNAFASVRVKIGETELVAQLTRQAVEELHLERGMAVFALIKAATFDRGT